MSTASTGKSRLVVRQERGLFRLGILPSRREARTDLRSFQSSDGNQVLPLSRPGQKIYCRMNIDEPTTSLAPSYQGPSPVILHVEDTPTPHHSHHSARQTRI